MPHDQQPITIQFITAPNCANCLKAQQAISATIAALRGAYPVTFSQLNLSEHPELLAQHDIWLTPAVIIDDELAAMKKRLGKR